MREIYKGLREIFGEKGAGMGVGDPIYAPTAPCRCAGAVSAGGVHSLPHGKERTKKTELGKPSSQRFCSPAKPGRRASATAKLSRGRSPLDPRFRRRADAPLSLRRACGSLDNETIPSWAHNRAPKMGVARRRVSLLFVVDVQRGACDVFRGACFEDGGSLLSVCRWAKGV